MLQNIDGLTVSEILSATGGKLVSPFKEITFKSISTSSLEIDKNCLFIPIVGQRLDGHKFIDSAVSNGALGYLTENNNYIKNKDDKVIIKVCDTKKALLDIAKFYRKKFLVDVIALTGSVGKTTTKEFISAVLKTQFDIIKTKANYNNEIGLPFTLFSIDNKTQKAVVEMGMSNFKEISNLTNTALPNVAIITNIGTSHIEFLKSRAGILKAKSEIFEGLNENGVAILNGDDDMLWTYKGKLPFKTVFFGILNKECDVCATDINLSSMESEFSINDYKYKVSIPGKHNIYNALCAYCVAKLYNMDNEKIRLGLLSYESDGIRQSIIEKNGVSILNDCYNSSPQAAIAAIDVLKSFSAKRKIAVLGDMAELGENSESFHKDVGIHFAKSGCDILITIGKMAKYIGVGAIEYGFNKAHVFSFSENSQVISELKQIINKNDAILIKGSHCMKMDEIAKEL